MSIKPEVSLSARLLQECRDIATRRLSDALPGLMDKVDDALFDLADKGENNKIQSFYFDAMREVRRRRSTIETGFRIELALKLNERIDGRAGSRAADGAPPDALLLMDHDELEESLAVTSMAAKIRSACKDELYRLDRRIAFLLDEPGLEGEGNPLGPEVICGAFKDACRSIESDIEVKLLILKLFDRFALPEMQPLYQALNEQLVKRDVLPNLRTKVAVRAHPGRPATAPHAPAAPGEAQGGAVPGVAPPGWVPGTVAYGVATGPSGGPVGLAGGQVLLEALQTWMQSGAGAAPPVGAGGGGGPGGATGGHLIADLTALQQLAAAPAGAHAEMAGAAMGSGTFDLRALKGEGLATLLGAAGGPIGAGGPDQPDGKAGAPPLGRLEEMLIDIVAMMFDYMFEDENLAPAMKALIGRLQIPLLKVAILDKTLFSRRFHPARKLLNAFAEAALGWNDGDEGGQALYAKMDALVHQVLDEFEDDVAVFAAALEELERYLAEEEAERQQIVARSAEALQRRARLDAAKAAAKTEIRGALHGVRVPPIVKLFLTRYWGGMLVVIHVKHGPAAPPWRSAVHTMCELVWSVTPKESAEERRRVIDALPSLLKRVNDGIKRVSMPPEERDQLVAALASCHAAVVRGPERAEHADSAPDQASPEDTSGAAQPSGAAPPGVATDMLSAGLTEPLLPEEPEQLQAAEEERSQVETSENPALEALCPPLPFPEAELLVRAIGRSNRAIFDASAATEALSGMATTVVVGLWRDNRLHYAHAGDSRLYRLQGNRLELLTKDHSLAQELVDKGFYTSEEAAAHINKNLVTRGLGVEPGIEPDIAEVETEVGDLFVLCSDGLSDMVEQRQIEAIARRYGEDLDGLADALVRAANDNGGRDNISVIGARILKPFPARKRWYVAKSLRGKVALVGRTDVGRRREHNEDSIALNPDLGAVVLADGMGGQNAGEVASAMAVRDIMADLGGGVPGLEGQTRPAAPVEVPGEHPGAADTSSAADDPAVAAEAARASETRFAVAASDDAPADAGEVAAGSDNPKDIDLFSIPSTRADDGGGGGKDDRDPVTEKMLSLLDRVQMDVESIVIDAPESEPAEDSSADARSPEPAPDDADILAFTGGVGGLPAAAAPAAAPGDGDGDEHDARVAALEVGTWVELEGQDGRRIRARLSWFNRSTGVHLFTDRRGLKVTEKSQHALAVELRRGSARVLESVPIYDRAVTSLLDHLRRKGGSDDEALLREGTNR